MATLPSQKGCLLPLDDVVAIARAHLQNGLKVAAGISATADITSANAYPCDAK